VIKYKYILLFLIWLNILSPNIFSQSQENYDGSYDLFRDPTESLWLGSYMNFRITEKIFWAGELHYRRTEYDGIPWIGRMAQVYNRHGFKYLFSKNFSATVGGVLRLDFTPEPGNPDLKTIILEPRVWHEYLFAQPFEHFMVYHRLRFEHRWSKTNELDSDYDFRNRYRYKFLMKIPINNRKLIPKTFYFAPDVELIMQSGSIVPFSPMEDLRFYPHIGYIHSPRIGGSMGMMYTLGQSFDIGDFDYRQRWIFRINAYISLDWRKFEEKLPPVNIAD
jgi:hypothetical protein